MDDAQYSKELNERKTRYTCIKEHAHKTIREHDTSFVSRTCLKSTRYALRKIVVLRAITVNPNTEKYTLKRMLNDHRSMGIKIWDGMKYLDKDLLPF
ncbi:MAG: hypothetical protein V3U58_01870 [Thermodesulfobacteriota bacterium]